MRGIISDSFLPTPFSDFLGRFGEEGEEEEEA